MAPWGDEDHKTTYMSILDRRGGAHERMALAKMTDLSERNEWKSKRVRDGSNDMRAQSKRKIKQIESIQASLTIGWTLNHQYSFSRSNKSPWQMRNDGSAVFCWGGGNFVGWMASFSRKSFLQYNFYREILYIISPHHHEKIYYIVAAVSPVGRGLGFCSWHFVFAKLTPHYLT